MRIRILMLLFFASTSQILYSQPNVSYNIFSKDGNIVQYSDLLSVATNADVVFFGELHNNVVAHQLEFQLTKDLFAKHGTNLKLGAEMFETDNQLIMNEYLNDIITQERFEDEMRLWQNYKTDYKPLVEFAKENGLSFVCTNVPRRYANSVYKQGVEILNKLTPEAKKFIAPLPFKYDNTLHCYAEMLEMAQGHGGENLPKSQALKDATMAHFIAKNFSKQTHFLHFNGSYHSDNNEGIVWYLTKLKPKQNKVTITTVTQKNITVLDTENSAKADFIIVTQEDLPSSY